MVCGHADVTIFFLLFAVSAVVAELLGNQSAPINGTQQSEQESTSSGDVAAYLIIDAFLVGLAALFAGLTLSLLGLDTVNLEIIADSGCEPDKTYARAILPVRRRGNELLCTLLLGSVMANTLIAQVTERIATGWQSTLYSTIIITLAGEILPQAGMSAHALWVGSHSILIVRFFMLIFYPITKPLAIFLDATIGSDPGQIFARNEFRRLIALHAASHSDEHKHDEESTLNQTEAGMILSAMDLREKTVMAALTPLADVFMLEAHEPISCDTLQLVYHNGFSRIPVYDGQRNNIVGVLYAKDLLLARPEEKSTVIDLVNFYRHACPVFPPETKLVSMLKYFESGKSHLGVVQEVVVPARGDPYHEVKGIVTLEDVFEELIQGEIFDEYDQAAEGYNAQHQLSSSILSARAMRPLHLSPNELRACALFLRESIVALEDIPIDDLAKHLPSMVALDIFPPHDARGLSLDDRANVWVYRAGVVTDKCTLVVSGRLEAVCGEDEQRIDIPSWSLLATRALTEKGFKADFSARVVQRSRILQIPVSVYLSMTSSKTQQSVPESK